MKMTGQTKTSTGNPECVTERKKKTMKKTFIFGLMAATLVFTACSEDDLNGNNGASNSNQKGMVLRATVEQPGDTRATFTDNEGVWQFAFDNGDKVSVTNNDMTPDFYTFTNEGTEFKCEEAKAAEGPVTWYAYFPSNEVSLVGQSGTKADVANKYALAGATASATTGEEDLKITMSPKVAILVINNQKGAIDISLTTAEIIDMSPMPPMTMPFKIQGLKANGAGFDLNYGDNPSLLSKTEKGTYYIAVPAGVQFVVKDGDTAIKSTGTNGLQAGKYYNLTIFPFGQGEAKATGIGNVRWIQLWKDGPKFAEYNVGTTSVEDYGGYYTWGGAYANGEGITWYDDHNTGTTSLTGNDDTATALWGSKWRMPTNAELDDAKGGLLYECNCTWTENYKGTDINGLLCTGKGDYESNSVFLPATGYCWQGEVKDLGNFGSYWSSTPHDNDSWAWILGFGFDKYDVYDQSVKGRASQSGFSVRPVLAE